MKLRNPFVISGALAAMSLLAPSAFANIPPLMAGGGSSAAFQAVADAAGGAGGATPTCSVGGGPVSVWTKKSGGTMHDVRSAGINDEKADVWVIWDGTAEPNRTICIYVGVDSGIGVRGFMAVPKALIQINQAAGTLGDNIVYAFTDVAGGLPANILADVNTNVTEPLDGSMGSRMNYAFSDIRPEDAQNATFRALSRICPVAPCAYASRPGLGYGNPNWIDVLTEGAAIGIDVVESFTATPKLARPVNFHIGFANTDPITGQAQSPWNTLDFGAIPVIPLVSNGNNASGGLGHQTAGVFDFNNVNRFNLSQAVDGTFMLTRDLLAYNPLINPVTGVPSAALPATPLTTIIREPLSGTYNTFEYTEPRTHNVQLSQEDGIDPTNIVNSNPLNILVTQSGVTGVRLRAVGTGDMVKAIAGAITVTAGLNAPTADKLGYAFWSYGNVAPCLNGVAPFSYTKCHYLAIDGVDGLYGSPSANPNGLGVLPQCNPTAGPPVVLVKPPCPQVPFNGLINGGYGSWNIVRLVTTGSAPPAAIQAVVNSAITQATFGAAFYTADILPAAQLGVFRSHRGSWSGVGARNGHECPFFDTGSDVGGAIYTIQSDIDFFLANGGAYNDCLSHENTGIVQ